MSSHPNWKGNPLSFYSSRQSLPRPSTARRRSIASPITHDFPSHVHNFSSLQQTQTTGSSTIPSSPLGSSSFPSSPLREAHTSVSDVDGSKGSSSSSRDRQLSVRSSKPAIGKKLARSAGWGMLAFIVIGLWVVLTHSGGDIGGLSNEAGAMRKAVREGRWPDVKTHAKGKVGGLVNSGSSLLTRRVPSYCYQTIAQYLPLEPAEAKRPFSHMSKGNSHRLAPSSQKKPQAEPPLTPSQELALLSAFLLSAPLEHILPIPPSSSIDPTLPLSPDFIVDVLLPPSSSSPSPRTSAFVKPSEDPRQLLIEEMVRDTWAEYPIVVFGKARPDGGRKDVETKTEKVLTLIEGEEYLGGGEQRKKSKGKKKKPMGSESLGVLEDVNLRRESFFHHAPSPRNTADLSHLFLPFAPQRMPLYSSPSSTGSPTSPPSPSFSSAASPCRLPPSSTRLIISKRSIRTGPSPLLWRLQESKLSELRRSLGCFGKVRLGS
jgi:hypothetical protein